MVGCQQLLLGGRDSIPCRGASQVSVGCTTSLVLLRGAPSCLLLSCTLSHDPLVTDRGRHIISWCVRVGACGLD